MEQENHRGFWKDALLRGARWARRWVMALINARGDSLPPPEGTRETVSPPVKQEDGEREVAPVDARGDSSPPPDGTRETVSPSVKQEGGEGEVALVDARGDSSPPPEGTRKAVSPPVKQEDGEGESEGRKNGKRPKGEKKPIAAVGKRVDVTPPNRERVPVPQPDEGRGPAPVPRLVCFYDKKQGRTVAVEFPEYAGGVSACFQSGCPLRKDSNDFWVAAASSLESSILAQWDGGEKTLSLDLPLIFRTRKGWEGRGIKHSGMTGGYYVVFAPESWTRKREGWTSEWSRYDGTRVHLFEILRDSDAMEDGFEEYDVFRFRGRFRLEGVSPFDDERGTIFMGAPPRIVDRENWAEVEWVVAGVEGKSGRSISPNILEPKNGEGVLPKIWESSQGGWFFARIYRGGELIHNPDFRFLRALRGIRVSSSVLPPAGGHRDMIVDVVGEGVAVESRQPRGRINVEGQGAIVKPRPGGGNVVLSFRADGAEIEAEFADPRVWWALDDQSGNPKWADKPLKISFEELQAVKNTAKLLLKLPGRGMLKSMEMGMSSSEDPARAIIVRGFTSHQEEDSISLRSFGDIGELSVIWARFPDVEDGREIPMLQIAASSRGRPPRRRRRMSGIVVGKALGTVQVLVKRKAKAGKVGHRKIRASDRHDKCRKGDRVDIEKLLRHPKAWRVVFDG